MPGITIDPPGAHDLDDALWLHEDTLTIYIPDMSIIPPGDPIEIRAAERGFTRYFATSSAPMLPRDLAENRLSLLPERTRSAIALHLTLDTNYDVTNIQVERGLLRSQAQLAYADVPAILSYDNHTLVALRPMLARMTEIGIELLRKRRERGELAFYDLKQALATSEDGKVRALKPHEANMGYVLVQEMMLLANRTFAEWMLAADIPALYRNHRAALAAPPRDALLTDISQMFAHPQVFDTQMARQRLQLLMGRARYSPVVEGHYALNLPCYTHVTSPLRRYADLVNNRVINELITARQENRAPVPPYSMGELAVVGDHLHALIMEQEKSRHEHFKAKAEQTARAHIETAPKKIAALSGAEFERIIKVSAQEETPSQAALESARLRMKRQSIRERELFLILFETPADNEDWQKLRLDALKFLTTHPYHAVSLLTMGIDLLSWPETEYQFGMEQLLLTCRALRQGPDGSLETELFRAKNKKSAQQAAALAICHLLCGVAPPVPLPAPAPTPPVKSKLPLKTSATATTQSGAETQSAAESPPANTSVAEAATVTASSASPASADASTPSTSADMDWEWIEAPVKAGNWVYALSEACLRAKQRKPAFQFSANKQKGVQNVPQWNCSAQLVWKGATYSARASAATKQVAKRRVSRQLLSAICPVQIAELISNTEATAAVLDEEEDEE